MRIKLLAGLATGLFMVAMVSTETFATSLIGYWNFEEGSGATALDSSGNALNGAISNAVHTAGRVGNYALDFNGSNSFVEVAYSPLLNPDSVSIALWFKPRSGQQVYADILDKGHGLGTDPYFGGYVLQYDGLSPSIGAWYGNGSTFAGVSPGGSYTDDQWHFLVANLGAAEIALYMDGQLIAKEAGAGPIVDNNSSLYIGRHRYLGRYFNGLIDDVRIFDGPLSQADVTQLYHSVPEPSTLALFGLGLLGAAVRRIRAMMK
jgi:hypothetical protein